MSLNLRIILSATLVLVIFISLTALTLDRAFSDSAETALHDKLTSQLYALMAAAEVGNEGLIMPTDELDVLLGLPSSGVYAFITSNSGETLWQSSSVLGAEPPSPVALGRGETRFIESRIGDADYYTLAYGVNWAANAYGEADALALTFNISTDLSSLTRQINRYRAALWGYLLMMAVFLLLSQALILRWGLRPLRQVGVELNRIENANQERIEAEYPHEIRRLTDNINILLEHEREHKIRYRNALGDLAHSLKTPLAVLQSSLAGKDDKTIRVFKEQIKRMNSIVEYQLQRAATAGSSGIGKYVEVEAAINRLTDSLLKVYGGKQYIIEVNVDPSLMFKGDEGDLLEILGNLLDNAFKWCKHHVTISAEQQGKKLNLRIEDDGPGMKPEQVEQLLQRGVRADEATPGHGIGLSIVHNIVSAYRGSIEIKKSALGGVSVTIVL
ncbi:MAG: ATP-binding protein [Gammaproteobacteria bacterium]